MTFIYVILFFTFVAIATPFILKLIFPHKITWGEIAVSIGVSLVVSGLSVLLTLGNIYNTEVWHGEVTDKRKVRTSCSHSYSCNCTTTRDSNGNSTTICQTCYEHSHDYNWTVFTTVGNINIPRIDSQGRNEPPRFSVVTVGEPASIERTYVDYIRGSHSVFNIEKNEPDHPFNSLVPNYPRVQDYYRIQLVHSTYNVSSGIKNAINDGIRDRLKVLGAARQANIVVVITDKDQSFGEFLRNDWGNGRKNDAVIVIGTDGSQEHKIEWAFVFGWSENQYFNINLRNELMDIGSINETVEVVNTISTNVSKYFERQSMSDFKYLLFERETSVWVILFVLLLQIGANVGISVFNVHNKITVGMRSRSRIRFTRR